MASFIIVEYSKDDDSTPVKYYRGGELKDFQDNIYRASNFRIEKNARDILSQMKNFNSPRELRKDKVYSVLPFQEAKKLKQKITRAYWRRYRSN